MADAQLYRWKVPLNRAEKLNNSGAIDLNTYSSIANNSGLELTLADGLSQMQAKLITTQSDTNSCTVTCSLDAPYVSFDLAGKNKALLVWFATDSVWKIIDEKGVILNS